MRIYGLLILCIVVITACSPANDSGGADSDSPNSVSDLGVTGEAPTAFPTFAFVQPTEAPSVLTAAANRAASAESTADSEVLARGMDRYVALECGSCHGDDGSGTDEGGSLLDYAASEEVFTDFMRTGGDIGNTHLFPAATLSNNGIVNLYQYVISLE